MHTQLLGLQQTRLPLRLPPIAEIAEEVGYSTSGSLINLFVKKVGTSPRQYRIQHMSKAIDAVCKTDVPFIDTDVPEL